jgi:hypothetical protein
MALQKDFVTDSGIEIVNAYFKINTIAGDREKLHASIGVYKDAQARLDGKPPAGILEYVVDTPNSENNLFQDIYDHLKTLVEFDDAQDV